MSAVTLGLKDSSSRAYVAAAPYSASIFTYTYNVNYGSANTGTLTAQTALTNCLKGDILHENGRKLVPGVNPGVSTFMVGVYNRQTGVSGFIDPNAPPFTIYNSAKPYYLNSFVQSDGTQLSTEGRDPATNGVDDVGASVLTNGPIGWATGTFVTQGSNNTTAVTANGYTGRIKLASAIQTTGGQASFVLTNSYLQPGDILYVNTFSLNSGTLTNIDTGYYPSNSHVDPAGGQARINVWSMAAEANATATYVQFAIIRSNPTTLS
jgi:hypothetical protein